MQLVDVERKADRRQRAPEAPQQLVIAPATADRRAKRGVVDLEHSARVVADVADQPEVEDHACGDIGLEQPVHVTQSHHSPIRLLRCVGKHLRATTSLRHVEQQLSRLSLQPGLVQTPAELDEIAAHECLQQAVPHWLAHPQAGHQRGKQRGVAHTHAIVL